MTAAPHRHRPRGHTPEGTPAPVAVPCLFRFPTPITEIALQSCDMWPPEAHGVQHACGISWDLFDIRRFLSYCKPRDDCLIWTGGTSHGQGNHEPYGSFWCKGQTIRAHRFYAVAVCGLRPGPGQELDHECDDSICVKVRLVSVEENRERIRRPNKQTLDLARFCNITPAEVFRLPTDRIAAYTRMMDVARQIEAGLVPHGVILTKPRTKRRKT